MIQASLLNIKPNTKVLITGATGFTGALLTKKLVKAGAQVRAIARASSDISQFQGLDIEWIRADVYDAEAIKQATKDIEYIFHVAAAFREAKYPDSEYRKVHVESTQLLAQAVTNQPNFKRFVHVSTIGVHGHIENPPANENSAFAPGDIYQVTKLEAEKWLNEYAATSKLNYTIIRPSAIYGPGDRRLLKLFKMASKPLFPILGYGKCLYHLIHVDDLTDAIIQAAISPNAAGETFIIGNEHSIALENIIKLISSTYGNTCRVLRMPVTPFFWAADLCELICKPFGIEPPIYRRRVAFYTKDRSFDTSKMREVLGFYTKHTNEAGIVETARWYADRKWLSIPNWKITNTQEQPLAEDKLCSNQ